MHVFLIILVTLLHTPEVYSDTWFSFDNTVSTGKITINGQEISNSSFALKGSGIAQTISRKVASFLSLHSQGSFDIKFRQGPPSLTISGDDNLINHVLTKVVKNTLHISMDKSYSSQLPLIVNVSSPDIKSITIIGTSHVELNAIKEDKLILNLFGTADLVANGTVDQLEITVQGAGDVKVKPLIADFVTVNLNGSGDIELTAKKQLDAKISGVGDIRFFGQPKKINKQISGVGDIEAGE